ncbi:hypothetical protein [Haladaptatus sp. NG-WS-4]
MVDEALVPWQVYRFERRASRTGVPFSSTPSTVRIHSLEDLATRNGLPIRADSFSVTDSL